MGGDLLNSALQKKLDHTIKELFIDEETILKATDEFLKSMDRGLNLKSNLKDSMPMIPSFVTSMPTGKEKGLFLAADLGGTNFRVCSVHLNGDHTFDLKQAKTPIPLDLMVNNSSDALFYYLAEKISSFMEENHGDLSNDHVKLGFTFSFPIDQTALNKGTLIRWTKGFDLPDLVGKEVVGLLQLKLDSLNCKIKVVALANDTVGTLLSRSYSNNPSETSSNTVVGAIFGTGTNGAYFERSENIKKVHDFPSHTAGMVINTEWGSFDNMKKVIPFTKIDEIVDSHTANRGYHMFEKKISGLFLGEMLRVSLVELFKEGYIFQDLVKQRGGSLPHRLTNKFEVSSEILSCLQIDDSTDLKMSGLILQNTLRLPTTKEERIVIQKLTQAIAHRASRLSAVPLAAILIRLKEVYADDDKDFEFGCDGAVVEFYPGFQEEVTKAISLIDPLKGTGKKFHIKIAKDGSGVGAALCATTVQ